MIFRKGNIEWALNAVSFLQKYNFYKILKGRRDKLQIYSLNLRINHVVI